MTSARSTSITIRAISPCDVCVTLCACPFSNSITIIIIIYSSFSFVNYQFRNRRMIKLFFFNNNNTFIFRSPMSFDIVMSRWNSLWFSLQCVYAVNNRPKNWNAIFVIGCVGYSNLNNQKCNEIQNDSMKIVFTFLGFWYMLEIIMVLKDYLQHHINAKYWK